MKNGTAQATFFQLTPFICFVGIFLISTLFFDGQLSPLFAALIAIIYSFFTFIKRSSFNKKVEIFLSGAAQNTVVAMCFIFIFSAAFAHVIRLIGGVDAAVSIGMSLVSVRWLLPGLFIIVSCFATAIGSSMGTIAAFMPIGLSLGASLGFEPSLIAGIVVSGAMLGDNLSLISDTTIAATQTVGVHMRDKMKANISLVIPAFIATILILCYIGAGKQGDNIPASYTANSGFLGIVKIIPYGVIFAFAAAGIDVIAVLVLGIFAALAIGVWLGVFTPLGGASIFFDGFLHDSGGMQEVLVLVLFVAGLSYIVEYNGGIAYLLEKMNRFIVSSRSAEIIISALVFLINSVVAVNTIAILLTGPIAKKVGAKYAISGKRIACLLDIVSCICQGVLPYAPQLVLAASFAQVSSVSIMPYLYYQLCISVVLILSMLWPYEGSSVR